MSLSFEAILFPNLFLNGSVYLIFKLTWLSVHPNSCHLHELYSSIVINFMDVTFSIPLVYRVSSPRPRGEVYCMYLAVAHATTRSTVIMISQSLQIYLHDFDSARVPMLFSFSSYQHSTASLHLYFIISFHFLFFICKWICTYLCVD